VSEGATAEPQSLLGSGSPNGQERIAWSLRSAGASNRSMQGTGSGDVLLAGVGSPPTARVHQQPPSSGRCPRLVLWVLQSTPPAQSGRHDEPDQLRDTTVPGPGSLDESWVTQDPGSCRAGGGTCPGCAPSVDALERRKGPRPIQTSGRACATEPDNSSLRGQTPSAALVLLEEPFPLNIVTDQKASTDTSFARSRRLDG